MLFKSKKGNEGLKFAIYAVLMILLLLLAVNLLGKGASPISDKFTKCSSAGGYWSDKVVAGDYEVKNDLIKPRRIGDDIEYCYIALPSFNNEFQEEYAKEIKETRLKEIKEYKNSVSTNEGGSSTTSSKELYLEINKEKKYFQPIKNPNTYVEGMKPNVEFYEEDDNTFKIIQNFKKDLKRCKVTIRPAKITTSASGASKLSQVNGLGNNDDFVVTLDKKTCEKSLTLNISSLKTLENTSYKNPGFYKLDYYYWFNETNESSGVRIAFIRILSGSSEIDASEPGSGKPPTSLNILEKDFSRDNHRTCMITFARDGDSKEYPVQFQTINTQGNLDISKIQEFYLTKETLATKLIFTIDLGSNKTLQKTKVFSFDDCNIVKYIPPKQFNFPNCGPNPSVFCSSYPKTTCNDPVKRDGTCEQMDAKCYWDRSFPIGDCLACEENINSCSDYDNKKTCESNQCFGNGLMNNRCFYDGDCQTCEFSKTYEDSCNQYKSRAVCERDPCDFGPYEGVSSCEWINKKCVKATN